MSDGSRWDWGHPAGPGWNLGGIQGEFGEFLGRFEGTWRGFLGGFGSSWEDFGDHSEGLWLPGETGEGSPEGPWGTLGCCQVTERV